MSDLYPSSASASDADNQAASSAAIAEAVQRAKQIASKIKPGGAGASASGVKRPFNSADPNGPSDSKRPATMAVAAIPGMMGGPGGMGGVGGEAATTEIIMVPDKMVGLIIGRGGEQITRLQAEFGCKIQMAQDSAGMAERQCTLTGNVSAITQAKQAIERIVANEGTGGSRGMGGGNGGGGGGPGGAPSGAGGGFFEMLVPGQKVGLIIGKGGETIKNLQEQSGAKIVIIQDSPEAAHEKPLRITGSPESVESAKHLVTEILNANDDRDVLGGFGGRGRGRGGGGMMRGGGMGRGAPGGGFMGSRGAPGGRGGGGRGGFNGAAGQWGGGAGAGGEYGGQATEVVQVPANKCGLVIGKGGETIKNINQSTGAHCEIDKNSGHDARDKNFIIRGDPQAVERAKNMILEKLGLTGGGGGYSGGGSGYGGGGSWGGSGGAGGYQQGGYDAGAGGNMGAAAAAAGGQPDYSAQWAEYYRQMGMVKEAEAIEATRGGTRSAAAPAAAAPQQPQVAAAANGGGSQDFSAQWAEYYRSIGKVSEAEAIEAQMKQKSAGGGGGQQQPYAAAGGAAGAGAQYGYYPN